MLPTNMLMVVLLLLQFENVLNEKLLQIFVGEVYTELFKAEKQNNIIVIDATIIISLSSRTRLLV